MIDDLPWVRFCVHPLQRDGEMAVRCAAPLADRRWVTSSGGTREHRSVITTTLGMGEEMWSIELTLTNRDEMGFRMLVGREAMRGRLIVDPKKSFRFGRLPDARARSEAGRPVPARAPEGNGP